MVHGGARRGQMGRCSPSRRQRVPPNAARRWDRTPGGAERHGVPWPGRVGPRRLGNAGDQPPLSYIVFHRRPVSLLSAPEKFPKLSCCRPLPARAGENRALTPRGSGTHAGAQGPQPPWARRPFSKEARKPRRLLARVRSRACRQRSAAGDWGAELRLHEGGDWRRE